MKKIPVSSLGANNATGNKVSSSKTLSGWLWPAIGVILLAYGVLAFNAGITLSPVTNSTEAPAAVAASVLHQAADGVDMRGSPEVQQVAPAWVNVLAELSSSDYAYGEDGISDTNIYYFSMSETRRNILSTHMMLGFVLMVAGFLQFWPAFRRRYRKAHRMLGGLYIIAAITSMAMSGHHLISSGIENTYNTFVFHIGLWIMLVGVLLSLTMAGIALFKKDIARHLAWQALGFGFLLTAPLQRMDWLILSSIADGVSFNEMNLMVNTILFAQATMGGLCLFWLNRASSPLTGSTKLEFNPVNAFWKFTGFAAILLSALILILPVLADIRITEINLLQRVTPESPLTWLATLLESSWLPVFVVSWAVLMVAGWSQLVSLRAGVQSSLLTHRITLASAIAVSFLSFYGAYQLGMPSHEHSSAGSGLGVLGALLLIFSILVKRSSINAEVGKVVESLQLLLLCATAPIMFVVNCVAFGAMDVVPAEYLARSAAYEISVIGAIFSPLVLGGLLSFYSAETARYRVN